MADDRDCNPEVPAMILLMGVTGSGKSYFLNQLVAGASKEGHGIHSGKPGCDELNDSN